MTRACVFWLLLLGNLGWAQTLEYRRPTADANSTNAFLRNAACGVTGGSLGSTSASAVYTGKSGPGPTGASVDQMAANGSIGAAYSMRLFTAWQAAGTSYSNLVVNISASCHIGDDGDHVGGRCGAAYSTDGGSTWNHIYSYVSTSTNGDVQTTWTATITGTPLSGVQVGVCALAASDPGGQGTSATITTYDIWTTGTTSSHTTGYVMRPYKQN